MTSLFHHQRSTARRLAAAAMTLALAFVAIPPAPARADQTMTIASWNVRNLSDGSRSDAELGIIGLIVFRYDFIALQEVRDEKVIDRIREILERDFQVAYDGVVSAPVGHNRKERYAFLWRRDRVAMTEPPRLYADPGDGFVREPFCGSFRAGTFDWTLCTVHILFGANKAARRPELLLLDDVYRAARDAGAEKDVIICGDFNFGPDDAGWSALKAEDGMSFAIGPPAKTTIADKSLYDNCWWPAASREIVDGGGSVFEYDELMYPPGSRKEANRLTSDHRPIAIRAHIDLPDDD